MFMPAPTLLRSGRSIYHLLEVTQSVGAQRNVSAGFGRADYDVQLIAENLADILFRHRRTAARFGGLPHRRAHISGKRGN